VRLDYHPEAVEEFEQAVDYYTDISPHLAARFIQEIESRIELVKESPNRWKRVRFDVRTIYTHSFPYEVVYAIRPERILILAIMHQKRKPNYWQHRVS
jgi:toxin ParE1/3/4